jgi:hypothetical protein
MSKIKSTILVGGGSVGSAIAAMSIMSAQTLTKEDVIKEYNPWDNTPIPYVNTYAVINEWSYTPPFNNGKSRKCSNKKYVKRKKARNGKR